MRQGTVNKAAMNREAGRKRLSHPILSYAPKDLIEENYLNIKKDMVFL